MSSIVSLSEYLSGFFPNSNLLGGPPRACSSLKWPRNELKMLKYFETYRKRIKKGQFYIPSKPSPRGNREGKKGITHFFEFVARDPGRQRGEGKLLANYLKWMQGGVLISIIQSNGKMAQRRVFHS